MSAPPKYVYDFAEGSREMRELLGGKGANVAEMTRVLGPDRVPAGFTITTEACVAYMKGERSLPAGLEGRLCMLQTRNAKRTRDEYATSVLAGCPHICPHGGISSA